MNVHTRNIRHFPQKKTFREDDITKMIFGNMNWIDVKKTMAKVIRLAPLKTQGEQNFTPVSPANQSPVTPTSMDGSPLIPQATDYQKLTHVEQIYKRCGMYIGSDSMTPKDEWIFDLNTQKMKKATITVPDGVERIYLEILSNGGDNVDRSRKLGVEPGVIEVLMNEQTISIKNSGVPIPVEMHPQHGVYVPELILGTLLTSSNYDDNKERTGIGLNGYGAKLTNIFSKSFMVIVCDGFRKLKYTQVWNENMSIRGEPSIEAYTGDSSVQIVYTMDFARFGYTQYPEEAFYLFARHAADISLTCKVPVIFNGIPFNVQDIRDYAALYFGNDKSHIVYYEWPDGTETVNKKGGVQVAKNAHIIPTIEMCVIDTPDCGEAVSFVNGMPTKEGGVHIDAAMKSLSAAILETINGSGKKGKDKKDKEKEKKETKLNMGDVRPHLSIILNCRLGNPQFTSQSKTKLMSPTPKINIPEKVLSPMGKWDLVERLYRALEAKQFKSLAKTDGKKRRHISLEKGEDANLAGGVKSRECTLYVVEGSSAMGYAENMIDLVPNGPDYIGLFPMKGKPLNVMNAPYQQIRDNEEITELVKMLGLRWGFDYTIEDNFNTLRYGHFVILADSDDDGKHIIGLVMNFFHCYFPSLLARGFVMYLRTPILRVYKGKQVFKFYTQREYEQWQQQHPDYQSWKHKYYKGLGTSSDEDVADDFKTPRAVVCLYDDQAPDSFRLAFDDKLADARKKWIAQWKHVFEVEEMEMQPISLFIHYEFIQFSIADLHRSLPRLMDGLKVTQRKVLWAAFLNWCSEGKPEKGLKRTLDEEKLVQFGAFVMKSTNYHHGDKSMSDTILTMIQDFVGMNNLPYFAKKGQFGTRKHGGADAAASRYPNTYPEWWIPYIFRKEDIPLLKRVNDEGRDVEPESFVPIIPMELVNGCHGIGTGHSTFIPNHNPLDLCEWIKAKIRGQPLPELVPWYRGFKGTISIINRARKSRAEAQQEVASTASTPREAADVAVGDEGPEDNDNIIEPIQAPIVLQIQSANKTENPPRLSMQTQGNYEIVGNKVIVTELPIGRWTSKYRKWLDKLLEDKLITDYRTGSSTKEVYFEIMGFKNPDHRSLKLQKSYGLTNMVLLSNDNRPIKYSTTADIMEAFFKERLPYYEARRQYVINLINAQIEKMEYKIRFIQAVISGQLDLMNKKKSAILPKMKELGLPEELLSNTRTSNLTEDEIVDLQGQIAKLQHQRQVHQMTSATTMWVNDLDEFENAYCRHYKCPLPGNRQPAPVLRIEGDDNEVPSPADE